jgi:hypothetical protein
VRVPSESALAKVSLEPTKAASKDCDWVIKLDASFTLCCQIRGIASLWSLDEEGAIAAWEQGT